MSPTRTSSTGSGSPDRHFLHVFSTFDAGGPQVRTARILELLPSSYRHTVVAMDGRTGCADRVGPDVKLELVNAPRGRGPLGTARAMAGLLREQRPDLLLTYNWGAIESVLGAKLAGQRAVVHHEEGFGDEESERLLPRRNALRRLLLRWSRAVIVPSQNLERIARDVWRQPAERVHYLPNGVDLARFVPTPRMGQDVVIGNVATFRPVKNQALLVNAFAKMEQREARLLLVGDGPDRAACEQLCRELGVVDRVTFAGTSEDTSVVYREMDVFAMSSRTEQMPLVVLEAMASGLPVASTNVGDVASMVAEPNRAFVVARDDASALASSLDRLVGDGLLRAELGAANRRRCQEEFEVGTCLGRYVDLFERVAAG